MSRHILVLAGILLFASVATTATAEPLPTAPMTPAGDILPTPDELVREAAEAANDGYRQIADLVDETTNPGSDGNDDGNGDGGSQAPAPSRGLADGLLSALTSPAGIGILALLGAAGIGGAGFLLATRYVDPKEALENPQRSMLYGCIKGRPGINLKQLSEDFDMKTSTVLWHMRKLEGAELVRSTKANGFRVFYPVEGGIEAKKLGSAVAALANDNATTILDFISVHPGVSQKGLVNALAINPGTVRWHLRKLKDTGLMAELSQGRSSTYYPTDLGLKALRQTQGLSSEVKPVPTFVAEAAIQ